MLQVAAEATASRANLAARALQASAASQDNVFRVVAQVGILLLVGEKRITSGRNVDHPHIRNLFTP